MAPRLLLRAFVTLTACVAAWFVMTPAWASNANASASASPRGLGVEASFAPVVPAAPAPLLPPSMRAPLCDPRGAITFAPPPQMQDIEVTLDVGLGADDCMRSLSGELCHAAPGRGPPPVDASWTSSDSALAMASPTLPRASRELVPAPAASTPCSRPGFRSTVDRPPRV